MNLGDTRYDSPPLGWALHGHFNSPAGSHGHHREVVALLAATGAKVEPKWLADEKVRADSVMLAALTGGRS